MIYLEVAVAAPLVHTLTYGVQPHHSTEAGAETGGRGLAGRRVHVPLGPRKVTGFILGPAREDKHDTFAIREVLRIVDDEPLFPPATIPFFRWLAGYYHYPIGLVIKSAVPGGLARQGRKKLVLVDLADRQLASGLEEQPQWLRLLLENRELSVAETAKVEKNKKDRHLARVLRKRNVIRFVHEMPHDSIRARQETCFRPLIELQGLRQLNESEDIARIREEYCALQGSRLKLSEAKSLYFLTTLYRQNSGQDVPAKELKTLYRGANQALPQLVEKKLVAQTSQRVFRSPFGQQYPQQPRPVSLSAEQQEVLTTIHSAQDARSYRAFLLHGITGSGKTEVYLRAAEKTLQLGREVIILVPEIALATQLESQLLSRFGEQVALLHSGLSASQKYDQYSLILHGKARVAIGARSAIFAPFTDPGLIIVDEEHDSSYKQDDSFRYHGRDVAVLRARHHGGVVILGSATPSVTSYANGLSGKYQLLSMKSRVGKHQLPKVEVIDLQKRSDQSRLISDYLLQRIQANLTARKQTILLLNRRGFSTAMLCRDCGSPVACNHCHISLCLHKTKNRLVCHYCGFSQASQTICSHCRSTDLAPVGFGTERVEEEIRELVPEARVKRLDSDAAADRKTFLGVLGDMHAAKIDILIGTQMIAKGHHFPGVTLVGVVWADGGMSMPDFRAAERTFQLITQVTGRAGRGEDRGEVIIQTLRPDHYAILFARNHQYEKMFEHEMRVRRQPPFPPYNRLTMLRIEGRVEATVQNSIRRLAEYCRRHIKEQKIAVDLLGPAPSPLDKLRDKYRWQILLKCRSPEMIQQLCGHLVEEQSQFMRGATSLIIDVDPENMM